MGICSAAQEHTPRFVTLDAPGATGGTYALGSNAAGAVVGAYFDANGVAHAFLRDHDGTFTTFDGPGAGTGSGSFTIAWSISPAGVVTGGYTDANYVEHGFLRNPDSTITAFDAPHLPRGIDPIAVGGNRPRSIKCCDCAIRFPHEPVKYVFSGNDSRRINAPGEGALERPGACARCIERGERTFG